MQLKPERGSATTTIRVSRETQSVIHTLARDSGESIQSIVAAAVEAYRRQRMFDEANAAWSAMQADPLVWQAELDERRLWEATLADGLEDEA